MALSAGALASLNASRQRTPVVGNLALQVEDYKRDSKTGAAYAVIGRPLNHEELGDRVEVSLMSAARAAAFFGSKDSYQDRKARFAESFEKRRALSEYGAVGGSASIAKGGVLMLNDVRQDLGDGRLYARSAFGAIQRADLEAMKVGWFDLKKFQSDAGLVYLRLSMLQPDKAFALSQENRRKVEEAFQSSVFGSGQTSRFAAVTIEFSEGPRSFPIRSGSIDRGYGRYDVTDGIEATLRRPVLRELAIGATAVAAVMGMRFEDLDFDMKVTREELVGLEAVHEAIASQEARAALTPGMQLPIFKEYQQSLIDDGRFVDRGYNKGVVAVRTRTDEVGALDRPMAKFIQSDAPMFRSRETNMENVSMSKVALEGFHVSFKMEGRKVESKLEAEQVNSAIFEQTTADGAPF